MLNAEGIRRGWRSVLIPLDGICPGVIAMVAGKKGRKKAGNAEFGLRNAECEGIGCEVGVDKV